MPATAKVHMHFSPRVYYLRGRKFIALSEETAQQIAAADG